MLRLAGAAETAELIDCIEVILTRLMTMPADDPAAEEALARLIEDTECLPRIDSVLAGRQESQVVRAWLTEAKLVLMGVGHVG